MDAAEELGVGFIGNLLGGLQARHFFRRFMQARARDFAVELDPFQRKGLVLGKRANAEMVLFEPGALCAVLFKEAFDAPELFGIRGFHNLRAAHCLRLGLNGIPKIGHKIRALLRYNEHGVRTGKSRIIADIHAAGDQRRVQTVFAQIFAQSF